ncbi:MAG: hypothetical protein ACTSVI_07470 [Promethearchaeota archaeon]
MTVVKCYRIRGYYTIAKYKFKYRFEKEVRDITPEYAIQKLKQLISSRKVNPHCIKIEEVYEVVNSNAIKDRIIKAFEENDIKM